jgi:hypothetical protein
MNVENIVRRVRGAVKNAMVWGVAWSTFGMATFLALRAIGVIPATLSALDGLGMSLRLGVMGGITGGAFSGFIALFYRGRRLSDISWVRFGIGGGVVAGVFVLGFLSTIRWLTGDGPLSLQDLGTDGLLAAAFGGAAAGASMWLAQRAERAERAEVLPGGREDELEHLEAGDPFASAGAKDARQRERRASGGNR